VDWYAAEQTHPVSNRVNPPTADDSRSSVVRSFARDLQRFVLSFGRIEEKTHSLAKLTIRGGDERV
jgi:hypothetical protein